MVVVVFFGLIPFKRWRLPFLRPFECICLILLAKCIWRLFSCSFFSFSLSPCRIRKKVDQIKFSQACTQIILISLFILCVFLFSSLKIRNYFNNCKQVQNRHYARNHCDAHLQAVRWPDDDFHWAVWAMQPNALNCYCIEFIHIYPPKRWTIAVHHNVLHIKSLR